MINVVTWFLIRHRRFSSPAWCAFLLCRYSVTCSKHFSSYSRGFVGGGGGGEGEALLLPITRPSVRPTSHEHGSPSWESWHAALHSFLNAHSPPGPSLDVPSDASLRRPTSHRVVPSCHRTHGTSSSMYLSATCLETLRLRQTREPSNTVLHTTSSRSPTPVAPSTFPSARQKVPRHWKQEFYSTMFVTFLRWRIPSTPAPSWLLRTCHLWRRRQLSGNANKVVAPSSLLPEPSTNHAHRPLAAQNCGDEAPENQVLRSDPSMSTTPANSLGPTPKHHALWNAWLIHHSATWKLRSPI